VFVARSVAFQVPGGIATVVVPVSGSYPQMRDFLKRSLAEIPVLSLDQISLRRESRKEGAVHAELRMTLHRVKS